MADSLETTSAIDLVERQLPEAPHWNGHGKYGPALILDECTLNIMSRGFGAKDGDGYLAFNPSKFDWDRDEDGNDSVVVPVSNSDLLFLRDQLNALFPTDTITRLQAALAASGHAELLEALAYLISCAPADCEMTKKAREVFAKFGGNHSTSLSGGENVR